MYLNDNFELTTTYSGHKIHPSVNPVVQKDRTYRILQGKYEEKKKKYDAATMEYKRTDEYARLGKIVKRLRGMLKQMEQDMSR